MRTCRDATINKCLRRLGHVRRLRAFLAFGNLELHLVAFLQALVSLGGDCAVVNKNIGSIRTPDEPIPFGVIEPLYGPFQTFHVSPRFLHVLKWGPKDVHRSQYDAFWSAKDGLSSG
jgi:hypothetical protein